MRRSTVSESRVSLSYQSIANKKSESNHVAETDEGHNEVAFPEDSWAAWSCLLGSFLMMLPSFGFQTAGKKRTQFKYSFLMISDSR